MKRMTTALALAGLVGVLLAPRANARTWYVNVYGTGDAPTIQAAMDSAVAGDTVLVGPGEYEITYESGHISVKGGVRLRSENGPTMTKIYAALAWAQFGVYLGTGSVLEGFSVDWPASWAIGMSTSATISRCIVRGSTYVDGWLVATNNLFLGPLSFWSGAVAVDFHNNIVYGDMICHSVPGQINYFYCNDILGEVDPCVIHPVEYSNFALDPLFCGIEGSENFYLQSSSPCAPGNTPPGGFGDCGLIGPLPVGCGTVRVEETTWGRVKALYGE